MKKMKGLWQGSPLPLFPVGCEGANASAAQGGVGQDDAEKTSGITTKEQMLEWYRDAKFGLFIHWGIYSAIGKEAWVLTQPEFNTGDQSGLDAYKAYIPAFRPGPEAVTRIVTLAKETGMRYIVLVSRHHDGFSLWDSQASDYARVFNSASLGAKTDVVRLFADECARQGIKLVLYYSLLDWTNPDYPVASSPSLRAHLKLYEKQTGDWFRYRAFMKAQLRELLTRYGEIAAIWFDGYWAQDDKSVWDLPDIYAAIRQAQPVTLIGNNQGIGDPIFLYQIGDHVTLVGSNHGIENNGPLPGEDFTIGERGAASGSIDMPGETADTIQEGTWGYVEGVAIFPARWIFRQLISSIARGKNFVLNIGPRPDGTWPEEISTELAIVGDWVKSNAEAIYGTRAGGLALDATRGIGADGKPYLYVFIQDPEQKKVILPIPEIKVRNAVTLAGGDVLPVSTEESTGRVVIGFGDIRRDPDQPLVLKLGLVAS